MNQPKHTFSKYQYVILKMGLEPRDYYFVSYDSEEGVYTFSSDRHMNSFKVRITEEALDNMLLVVVQQEPVKPSLKFIIHRWWKHGKDGVPPVLPPSSVIAFREREHIHDYASD